MNITTSTNWIGETKQMMYAGYYAYDKDNGMLIYGENQTQFNVQSMTVEKFLQQIDIDFDWVATNLHVEETNNHIIASKAIARNYSSYSNVRQNTMLTKILEKYKVDLSEYVSQFGQFKVEYAYMYYQLAIKDRMQKLKQAIKRANRKAELQKRQLEQMIYLNKLQANAVSDYMNDDFNFDNVDWHCSTPLNTKTIQTSIHIADAKNKGFKQVFPNSRFFFHAKNKTLWMQVGQFLCRLNPQDYIDDEDIKQ